MYEKSMTVEQAQDNMIPLLKEHPVQCALCGREFDRLTPGHIRTHAEFLLSRRKLKWFRTKAPREFEGDEEESQSNSDPFTWGTRNETMMETYERLFGGKDVLTACIRKLFELYQPNKAKWLLMDKPVLPRYATWYEVSDDNPAFVPNRLCVPIMKEHLTFRCTVGIFPKHQTKTRFLTWDVDAHALYDNPSWDAATQAKKAVSSVTSTLRKWGLHPHVVQSGQKGYHVTVFFDYPVPITIAMKLFKAVLEYPGGPVCGQGLRIECLPIQRGNKLPLGTNWKTGVFCGFVDPLTLDILHDPYQYLIDIIPDSSQSIWQIEDEALSNRKRESTIVNEQSWSMDVTREAFLLGISAPGTRHDTLVRVAAYIRNTPALCPETSGEFEQALLTWSETQYEEHGAMIRTGWYEHARDVKRVSKYAWAHPLTAGVPRTIRIAAGTVHWVRSQTPVLAEQQLLFAAWFESAIVGDYFHLGYEQAKGMTKLAKNSLDTAFKGLREKTILVVEEDYFNGGKRITPSKTRKYRFENPPPELNSMAVILTLKADKWEPTIWFRLLRTLFTVDELRVSYPYAYHRILTVEPLPIGRSAA